MHIYKWLLLNCTFNQDRLADGGSWISETSPIFQVCTFDFLRISSLLSKNFYIENVSVSKHSLTFVLLKTHCKDPKSYESSKELLPNVYWLSVYFHLVCLFSTWNERQITNDEMKFLLALESNRFPKYLMVNVVNTFNKNIICRHLIVTSNFPQK